MNNIFDIPADLDTPTSVYLKLAPLGPRFLLESVEQGDQVGRFSFIGFGPGLDVRSDGRSIHAGTTELVTDGSIQGLMDGLRKVLVEAPAPGPTSTSIPFHGGLVGAIGFDVAHRLAGWAPPPSPTAGDPVVWAAERHRLRPSESPSRPAPRRARFRSTFPPWRGDLVALEWTVRTGPDRRFRACCRLDGEAAVRGRCTTRPSSHR